MHRNMFADAITIESHFECVTAPIAGRRNMGTLILIVVLSVAIFWTVSVLPDR
jgi:hypothetical protein